MSDKGEVLQLAREKLSLREMVDVKLKDIIRRIAQVEGENHLYRQVMEEVENSLIRLALEETGHNQLQAAKILGINRNTLRKKAKQFGL